MPTALASSALRSLLPLRSEARAVALFALALGASTLISACGSDAGGAGTGGAGADSNGGVGTGGSGAGATSGGAPSDGGGGGDPGSGGSSGSGGGPGLSGPLVFGYVYELGDAAAGIPALPLENVDVVVHAFVTADGSGNVVGVDNFDAHRNAGLVETAHAAGKKVVLSLGGAGSTWQMAELIGTPAQDTFIANVAARVGDWGYDGVDFDFEFPGNNCTPAEFTDFLSRLGTAVKNGHPERIVMFGISPGWWLGSYEWSNLAGIADYGFYFCYDWNNPERGPMTRPAGTPLWSMESGAQIEPSCRGALDYITGQGFPVGQLIVGLPFAAANGSRYSSAGDAVKTATPDQYTMEAFSDGTYWTNAAAIDLKTRAVLNPAASVLSGGGVAAGVGFWEWGEENFSSGADLSTAMRQTVDSL